MSFVAKPAEPIDSALRIALAGPQASGKTTSALRLATGIVSVTGGRIFYGDTENKRALRYAKNFKFLHIPFDPPFSPGRYLELIDYVTAQGAGPGDVMVIDSMSQEHEGPGGVLEMHEAFLDKHAENDWKKREKLKFTAWIKPKAERTRTIIMGVQRVPFYIILCFRAKEKVAMVKVMTDGKEKTEVVNAGIQPIGGEEYFFEMDITMILPEGSAGKPDWNEKASRINEIGEGPLKKLLHNTSQIGEETGAALARLCMVTKPITKVELSPEQQKVQDLGKTIIQKIGAAKDAGELDSVLYEYNGDLEMFKINFQKSYDHIMAQKDKKLAALGVPT